MYQGRASSMLSCKTSFCTVNTAVADIRSERPLLTVYKKGDSSYLALVMASDELCPFKVRAMSMFTSGLVCISTAQRDSCQVTLPKSLERSFTLRAVFPPPAEERNKIPLIPFAAKKRGVLHCAAPGECIADLADLAGGGKYRFVSVFAPSALDRTAMPYLETGVAPALHLLDVGDLVRFRLQTESHRDDSYASD
jgi:3,4-dihydroxy-2-butanone 4-phosphate synthase